MSVNSMTGYGRGRATVHGLHVEVEISSVNRRQLDVQIHVPDALRVLESRIQGEITRRLARGRIVADIAVTGSDRLKREAIRIDHGLAASYLKRLRAAAAQLGLPDDLRASLLLTLPGVLHYEPLEDDVERIWPALLSALKGALRALQAMRSREGAALQKDVQRRSALLVRHLAVIRKRAPENVKRFRAALTQRLREAGLDPKANGARLEQELILYADKSDISEELTRLDSHLRQVRDLLRSREPAGRALDFLCQEMNREINTIGSKANDATISGAVVAFKTELERLREQAQNIE